MTVALDFNIPALYGGCIEYYPDFLGETESSLLLDRLWNELQWSRTEITLFGRAVMQPRLVAWYGDPEVRYSYSGITLDPIAWHPSLLEIKCRIEAFTGRHFNSVLANAYRDGRDSMGWHRDDEKELGPEPFIASLSLGEERRFLLRENGKKSVGLTLESGSLLLMKDSCQQKFQHALPKTRRKIGLRINLTFRAVKSQAPV